MLGGKYGIRAYGVSFLSAASVTAMLLHQIWWSLPPDKPCACAEGS